MFKEIYAGQKDDTIAIVKDKQCDIVGLIRLRNEDVLLNDTLDYMATICDGVVVYDDCSEDESYNVALNHPIVLSVIKNELWQSTPKKRDIAETYQRQVILDFAQRYNPKWIYYTDADERCIGDIKEYLKTTTSDAIRVPLFDAYITEEDKRSYSNEDILLNFRQKFGPERRDIIMFWRNQPGIKLDHRVPLLPKTYKAEINFVCQHYGKSLSIQHWEDTCDYYINHRKVNNVNGKWTNRKGKAVHNVSDFGRPLYKWGEELFKKAVRI